MQGLKPGSAGARRQKMILHSILYKERPGMIDLFNAMHFVFVRKRFEYAGAETDPAEPPPGIVAERRRIGVSGTYDRHPC